jgi:hypothetical protein
LKINPEIVVFTPFKVVLRTIISLKRIPAIDMQYDLKHMRISKPNGTFVLIVCAQEGWKVTGNFKQRYTIREGMCLSFSLIPELTGPDLNSKITSWTLFFSNFQRSGF